METFERLLAILFYLIWIVIGGVILIGGFWLAGHAKELGQGVVSSVTSQFGPGQGGDQNNQSGPGDQNQQGQGMSPEQMKCLEQKLGQSRAQQLATGSQPTAAEQAKAGNCFGPTTMMQQSSGNQLR